MKVHRLLERDPEIPCILGDEPAAPDEQEVLQLVRDRLALPGGPLPRSARWVFARWKPAVALTVVHEIEFEEGAGALVTIKRYATDKGRRVAAEYAPGEHAQRADLPLRPFAAHDGSCFWTFPADRVLVGAARVWNGRRTARWLESLGLFEELALRRGASRATLLRYKPEHRAVFRFDAHLRQTAQEIPFALRALSTEAAARVCAIRSQLAEHGAAPGPRLLGCEQRSGIVVEEWLGGTVRARDDFSAASEVGKVLARLHVHGSPPRGNWLHGDFHPDQVVLDPEHGMRFLDFDSLRVGNPETDLASWIADAISAAGGAATIEAAGGELIDGYRAAGGGKIKEARLASCVARALTDKASGFTRRLEVDAVAKMRAHLAWAAEISSKEARRDDSIS